MCVCVCVCWSDTNPCGHFELPVDIIPQRTNIMRTLRFISERDTFRIVSEFVSAHILRRHTRTRELRTILDRFSKAEYNSCLFVRVFLSNEIRSVCMVWWVAPNRFRINCSAVANVFGLYLCGELDSVGVLRRRAL